MALQASDVRLSNGRVLPSAYVKATITGFITSQCSLLLEVWENAEDRLENDPLDRISLGIQNPEDLTAANPLEYAYGLLKQRPEFSSALDV